MSATSDIGNLIDINFCSVDIVCADGAKMNTKIIKPQGYGPHPVIVLMMGMLGVTPSLCSLGRLIAEEGYAVIIPDLYRGTIKFSHYRSESFDEGLDAMHTLSDQLVVKDIANTLDFIAQRRDMDESRVSLLGHCLGGRLSLLAGNYLSHRIRCISSYYATGLESSRCSFRNIKVPVQLVVAGNSLFCEPEALYRTERNIRENNNFVDILSYASASHNFLDMRDQNYDPVIAAETLHRSMVFLNHNSCLA